MIWLQWLIHGNNSQTSWPLYWHSYNQWRAQRMALLWGTKDPSPQKETKITEAGPLWWTMLAHWWGWGQSQLNHLSVCISPFCSNRWNPGTLTLTWPLLRKQQVQRHNCQTFSKPVCLRLKGRSQDPSVTITCQTGSLPAQILFSHTLSLWDNTTDLFWQIKSWIRQTELFLPMTLCCWLMCASGHSLFTLYRYSNISDLILVLDLFVNMQSLFSLPLHHLNTTISRRICSLTGSFTWESVQMCR